ncbi:MAG: heme-binding protein [Pseudomonadota bacterium]
MEYVESTARITHRGVMAMLAAGMARAEEIGQPQCIVIVDQSGEPLGEIRMTGAKFLSRRSALAKAVTAASHNMPSASVPEAVRPALAAATAGGLTGLGGGLPVRIVGVVVGGIGVGSGSPEQDLDVARAALAAIGADQVG